MRRDDYHDFLSSSLGARNKKESHLFGAIIHRGFGFYSSSRVHSPKEGGGGRAFVRRVEEPPLLLDCYRHTRAYAREVWVYVRGGV